MPKRKDNGSKGTGKGQGKKAKKVPRTQRDYDDSGDEMIEKEHSRSRLTGEQLDSNRRRWQRGAEVRFDSAKMLRFAKPEPAPKPKAQTSTQRRNARKKKKQGEADGVQWPTRNVLRKKRGLLIGAPSENNMKEKPGADLFSDAAREFAGEAAVDDASEEGLSEAGLSEDGLSGDGGADEEAASDEDEDEQEGDEEVNEEQQEQEEQEEEEEESEEEEEEAEAEDEVDDEDEEEAEGRARSAVIEAQYNRPLTEDETAELKQRRDPKSFKPVASSSWSWSGGDELVEEHEDAGRRLAPVIRQSLGSPTALQRGLLGACSSYRDVLATNLVRCEEQSSPVESRRPEVLEAVLAHLADHVLRSRRRVLRHNKRKASSSEQQPKTSGLVDGKLADVEDDTYRDQGFARPRALVLVPMRCFAQEVVKKLAALWGVDKPSGRKRLEKEFGEEEEQPQDGPADWKEVFGAGNMDDDAMIGLALQMRARGKILLQCFAPVEDADVIIATPLALKLALERKDEEVLLALSSLEVVVVDQADVMLMQNWEHVGSVLSACNRVPSKLSSRTDFSRVRLNFLEGLGAATRQLVLLSRHADPRLRALVDSTETQRNRAGCARLANGPTPDDTAALALSSGGSLQVFQPVRAQLPAAAAEAKMTYFANKILPPLLEKRGDTIAGERTLIFCATYHEFLAARAQLRKRGAHFVSVHEYSRGSEVSRSRSRFFHAQVPIMLYSGRAHFYSRYRIRGATRLIFLSPPDHAQVYPELVALLRAPEEGEQKPHVLTLYTRFDSLQIERLVGKTKATELLKPGDRNTDAHLFC